eukprot:c694_g1_i2.p1 GENE.c694_g1_i2~~c694_g1_i2.p1  ORF type:complete len:156 (+),score=38.57 c694_g1_i2:264-731(+)
MYINSFLAQGFLQSDADEQLILYIPFTCSVNIRSICVIGHSARTSPASMRLFINRQDIDFDNANDVECAQRIELVENLQGRVEFPTKFTKFQGVNELVIFFDTNFGADTTEVIYIGLKGLATQHKREVVTATYELKPLPASTKTPSETTSSSYIS